MASFQCGVGRALGREGGRGPDIRCVSCDVISDRSRIRRPRPRPRRRRLCRRRCCRAPDLLMSTCQAGCQLAERRVPPTWSALETCPTYPHHPYRRCRPRRRRRRRRCRPVTWPGASDGTRPLADKKPQLPTMLRFSRFLAAKSRGLSPEITARLSSGLVRERLELKWVLSEEMGDADFRYAGTRE